jgi:hypothetical protein
MAIPTYDRLTQPTGSANQYSYDVATHQYTLDPDYADFRTGLSLSELWQGNDNVLWYLEAVRNVCYTYILKHVDPKYRERVLYYIAHSKKAREAVIDLMVDTIQYNFEDGGFLIAYQTGINLHEMKEIKMRIENAVSVIGEKIIENFGLKERVLRFNLNNMDYFDDLQELLDFMVDLSFLTQEQADEIDDIYDIPKNYQYRVFAVESGQLVLEDLLTWKVAMQRYGVDW